MPKRWVSQFLLLAGFVLSGLLLGLWFGAPAGGVLVALSLYLANILRHLYALDRAIERGKALEVPEASGLWAELFARLNKQQTKLRNRKKKYHRLLREVRESTDALTDGGIILNPDHEIQWFNASAARLLGLDPARDMKQRIDNLLRQPEFVRYLAAPEGEPIMIPSPIDDAGRLVVQIIPYGVDQKMAIFRDVTRQLQIEQMRRDFVANASHELRSPLTVLGGYLDGLGDDDELPDNWAGPVAEMQRQVDRMTRILRDLLELARMESSGRDAGCDFVDVVRLVEEIRLEFSDKADAPALELDMLTDVALLGSEPELHSIFYNLILNAVRFTPADGRVKVTWSSDDAGATFAVEDTGIGIPEEQIPRVTERFFRVDPGRSRELGGTGLGLAIVKHALQRHGGTLEIESVVGEGSRFQCRFPESRIAERRDPSKAAI